MRTNTVLSAFENTHEALSQVPATQCALSLHFNRFLEHEFKKKMSVRFRRCPHVLTGDGRWFFAVFAVFVLFRSCDCSRGSHYALSPPIKNSSGSFQSWKCGGVKPWK